MATTKQRQAARKNIKKAQEAWESMSLRQRGRAQPEGGVRKTPGATGQGEYYHVEVRPKNQFTTFRTQDVGKKGGIQRVAGKRSSGSWDDQKWLIGKNEAHIENDKLVPDTKDAKEVLKAWDRSLSTSGGDRFTAKPRPNVPEEEKPTAAQRRAQRENIKKAQAARRKA